MPLRFSVPYNNKPETLRELVKIKNLNGNSIEEVYFNCPQEYSGSGRMVSRLTTEDAASAIRICHENGIQVNMAMNFTCQGGEEYTLEFTSRIIKMVKKFHYEYGLDGIIMANPLYIQKVKKEVPSIQVIASAFSEIDCVERAVFFDKFGADVLTLNGLNRNLEVLKEIKELTDAKLRLMVNEGCLYKCPYRMYHANITSHGSRDLSLPIDFCADCCVKLRKLNPTLMITSDWILPQWLKYYRNITEHFKIVGRSMGTGWITNRVRNYMQEEFKGNLLELLESNSPEFVKLYKCRIDVADFDESFFRKITSCGRKCFACGYCGEFAKRAVSFVS
jgi:collagenase-like PrtC family protease